MTEISMQDLAEAAAKLVISRLDEKYWLVYIDRGDSLADEQIRNLFAGEMDVLDEHWESENRWHGVKHVLENLLDAEAREFLEEHGTLDQVREAIEERDHSDPIGDLMRTTGPKLMRYQLDAEAAGEPWRLSEDEANDAARRLGDDAGIDFEKNADALQELVAHASYGGNTYLLWHGDITPMYDAVCKVRHNETAPEITIQWVDPELLVLDTWNGSGYSVRVRGTVSLPFEPDRLSLDMARGAGGYSWTDVVGGGCRPEGDEPKFIETANEESKHG